MRKEKEVGNRRNVSLCPKAGILHSFVAITMERSSKPSKKSKSLFGMQPNSAEDRGYQLMRKAFDPKNGPLTDQSQVSGQRQAISDLFAGAIGLYKNPSSHRSIIMTPTRAVEAIMLTSLLVNLIEDRQSTTS
jgi:hypothetical protein